MNGDRYSLHYEKFSDGTVRCIEDALPFALPMGWEWTNLSQLYNFIDYRGATPTKVSVGVPLVTAKNVKRGFIDYSIDEYISEEEYLSRQQRGTSRKGDILFTTEAPLGNVALADLEKYSAGQRLITFQQFGFRHELCNQLFVFFLLSDCFQHQLSMRRTGSTVAGIKAAILKTLIIPVPPVQEQLRITSAINSLFSSIDSINASRDKLKELVNITKSKILDLAIRGKLVSQDPNDEPASVLLERIRQEKEELIKTGKIKRDKRESVIFRGEDNSYYELIGTQKTCIDNEIHYHVPNGWAVDRLKNVYAINPKNDIANDETIVSFVPMCLINDQFSYDCNYEHKQWKDCKKGFTHFADGDLGFAKISPCFENRKSVIFSNLKNGYGAGTTELHVLRNFCEGIIPQYTILFLKSASFIERGVSTYSGTVGQQRIDKNVVMDAIIPIPPQNEQIRIADRVKQLFSILDSIQTTIV